jgi:hypothetical protein
LCGSISSSLSSICSSLSICGSLISSSLGSSSISGSLSISSSLISSSLISGSLGSSSISGSLSISSSFSIDSSLGISGSLGIGNSFSIGSSLSISDSLGIGSSFSIGSSLISGNLISGSLGSSSISGSLGIGSSLLSKVIFVIYGITVLFVRALKLTQVQLVISVDIIVLNVLKDSVFVLTLHWDKLSRSKEAIFIGISTIKGSLKRIVQLLLVNHSNNSSVDIECLRTLRCAKVINVGTLDCRVSLCAGGLLVTADLSARAEWCSC